MVLHDELEGKLGNLKRRVGGSARGHNGIKSLVGAGGERLGADGRGTMVRIGVGIGRPVSRESEDVSDWVLRNMTAKEKGVLGCEAVRKGVLEMLEGL